MGTKLLKEGVTVEFIENLIKLIGEHTTNLKSAGKLAEKEYTDIFSDLTKLNKATSDDEVIEILETISKKSPELEKELSSIVVKSLSVDAKKGLDNFKSLLKKYILGKDLPAGVKKMTPDMAQKNIDTFIEKNVTSDEVVKKYIKEDLEKYVDNLFLRENPTPKPNKVPGINNRTIKTLTDEQIKKYERIWNAKGFSGKFIAELNKFYIRIKDMFTKSNELMDEVSSIIDTLLSTEPQKVGQIEALSKRLNELYTTIANKEKNDFAEIKLWLEKVIKPIDYKLYNECISKKGYRMAENIITDKQMEEWVKEYGDLKTRRKKLLQQLVQVANPVDWFIYKGTFVKKWYDLLFSTEFKELRSEVLLGQTKSLKASSDYIKYFGLPNYIISVGKEWLYGYIVISALDASYNELMDFTLNATGLMNSLNFEWVKKRRENYKESHPGKTNALSVFTDFLKMCLDALTSQTNITPGLIDNLSAVYNSFRDKKITNETVENLKKLKKDLTVEKAKIEGIARTNGISNETLIDYFKEYSIEDTTIQLNYSIADEKYNDTEIILCQTPECNKVVQDGKCDKVYVIPKDGKYYWGFGKTDGSIELKNEIQK
jgi:hypothetical protein